MKNAKNKLRIAVHKFSSCDGCQLAFLNAVGPILRLSEWIEIVHFAEAGPDQPGAAVDIAFVEGSIATHEDITRIQDIRAQAGQVISIGACATSGGIQALRNMSQQHDWIKAIYTNPEYIDTLEQSTPIAHHIHVDHELWGCPVSSQQILNLIQTIQLKGQAKISYNSVCGECKRKQHSCVMVSQGIPCMGPVTRSGCHALCPGMNRGCYGCYGPADYTNTEALARQFSQLGLDHREIALQFLGINSQAEAFKKTGLKYKGTAK